MKLMVIDGNSIINRAFYGVRPLSTRDGTPTNAVYGFLNILLKLLDEDKPDALAVTFDRKAPTFRHRMYEGYKATRHAMPDDLAAQMPILKDVLRAMNVPMYELDGWEADDLLGTMARVNASQGGDTVIVTGDKDALQLVDDHTTVKLVSTRMGQTTTRDVTPDEFRGSYGFDPIHMIDLKALMGDSSDNYPGVKGVGEKTALALIQLYHTVEHLYDHMPDICSAPDTPAKPGLVKKLTEGADSAKLCKELAAIRCDAPMGFDPADAKRRPFNESALYQLLLNLEFTKLIDKLKLTPYQSAAEAAQAVAKGETGFAVSHQSQILETFQQGGVTVVCAFDEKAIENGPFAGVEGVGSKGYPYFRNRCFVMARAGTDEAKVSALKDLYGKILADKEVAEWLQDTMLLEVDTMSKADVEAHIENVKNIVNEYKDIVAG